MKNKNFTDVLCQYSNITDRQTATVISVSYGITDNPKQREYQSKVLLQLSC